MRPEGRAAPAAPFDRNGTFVVYRKLAMDVAAFRRFVAGAGYPGGPDLLAAKLVGRWPDGTPLVRSPERPDPALAAEAGVAFHFSDELPPRIDTERREDYITPELKCNYLPYK